jgi:transketolase
MKNLIKKIINVSYVKKEGHIPSSLSILDLLYVIYLNFILNTNNKFILSKGHASLGLYTILDHFKLLNCDLNSFCNFNSPIGGHPCSKNKHIECSTGSLGHGLPFAAGMALSKKIKNEEGKIIVIIVDGESNEGTIWETALLASQHNLNNLICIMDHNHSTDRAVDIGNILDKFKSFSWDCLAIDGHNHEEIKNALSKDTKKPYFILANTIKGKGCKILENNPEWHHKFPSDSDINLLLENIY